MVTVTVSLDLLEALIYYTMFVGALIGSAIGLTLGAMVAGIILRKTLKSEPKELKLVGSLFTLASFVLCAEIAIVSYFQQTFASYTEAIAAVLLALFALRYLRRAKLLSKPRSKPVLDSSSGAGG